MQNDEGNVKTSNLKKYCVEINGPNFLISVDGCIAKYGFFTVRFIEARDHSAAESLAVESIRGSRSLRGLVKNGPTDPPVIYVT